MKPPDCKGKTKLFFNLLVFCAQDPEMAGDSRKRTPRPPEASLQLAKLPPSSPGAPSYLACPEAASANHHKRGARIEQKCHALSDLKARSPSEVSVLRATPLPASSCHRWAPASLASGSFSPASTPRWSHCLRPFGCSHRLLSVSHKDTCHRTEGHLAIQGGLALSSFKDPSPDKAAFTGSERRAVAASLRGLLFDMPHSLTSR